MVFRWLLPRDGGGAMRRYMKFRKEMLRRQAWTKDIDPFAPISLFDFGDPDDAADAKRIGKEDEDAWRLTDDRVIGGFSTSSARLIRSKSELFRFAVGQGDEDDDEDFEARESTHSQRDDETTFIPFLKWKGTIDKTIGDSKVQRSGFAALRSPPFPMEGANLKGMYEALEITCRTDGRMYNVNLRLATLFPNDMYQGYLQESNSRQDPIGNPAGDFHSFILPFRHFSLASKREMPRDLDNEVRIESVGFALMDGEDGDFQFDLARIRAVNLRDDGRVYEGNQSDLRKEHQQ